MAKGDRDQEKNDRIDDLMDPAKCKRAEFYQELEALCFWLRKSHLAAERTEAETALDILIAAHRISEPEQEQ